MSDFDFGEAMREYGFWDEGESAWSEAGDPLCDDCDRAEAYDHEQFLAGADAQEVAQ